MGEKLLSVENARKILLSEIIPLTEIEEIPTEKALSRVLAEARISPINLPQGDYSERDGYALCAGDFQDFSQSFEVSQRILAGDAPKRLKPKTAARIFTGATIPQGADTVVMQEDALEENGIVKFKIKPKKDAWVRRAGEELRKGATFLTAGTRLRPPELGILASVGMSRIPVFRRVKAAIFSTGNELLDLNKTAVKNLPLGMRYNSNGFTLHGLLDALCCKIKDYGVVPDNLEKIKSTLREAAKENDLIITTGGVSVGDADYVREAVSETGKISFWKVAMKPGKPLAFGAVAYEKKQAYFIGLPGNPVSALVCFALFVKPLILRLQNVKDVLPKFYNLRADFDFTAPETRTEFLRARLNDDGGLELFENQASGALSSAVWAHGLIERPAGVDIKRGSFVRFYPFETLFY